MQPKKVFVLSSLKAKFLQRASFHIYPSYVWKNGKIRGIAPRQINFFSIKPVLGKNKPHTSLCRCDETVITRIRIGQSNDSLVSSVERESTRL